MSAQAIVLAVGLSVAISLLLALRIYLILPRASDSTPSRQASETCSLGVFLGSGGHTSEMRTLLSGLDFDRYTPRIYVYCPGDDMSLRHIKSLESDKGSAVDSYSFIQLPRARRVAQPLSSTIRTSLWTLCAALYLFLLRPLMCRPTTPWVDVLLVNGPGTCVLVVGVSWIRRILGLNHTKIIYVESFARVHSLSLSGKILRPFVDQFVVQWPTAGDDGQASDGAVGPSPDGRGASGAGGNSRAGRIIHRGWLV